ncbi:hypothetical protein CASFOL_011834 [Castilleja foliolosa]|uniref:Uncharacterized protein n=1 Tax=Castilleja foliolosa TaxID=1961234 RepID=A0ABD3DPB7_9LAMI
MSSTLSRDIVFHCHLNLIMDWNKRRDVGRVEKRSTQAAMYHAMAEKKSSFYQQTNGSYFYFYSFDIVTTDLLMSGANTKQCTFESLLKDYGFLTLDIWKETRFTRSPYQEYTDITRF